MICLKACLLCCCYTSRGLCPAQASPSPASRADLQRPISSSSAVFERLHHFGSVGPAPLLVRGEFLLARGDRVEHELPLSDRLAVQRQLGLRTWLPLSQVQSHSDLFK